MPDTLSATLAVSPTLSVSCSPYAKAEARFIHREIFVDESYTQHGVTINDGDVVFDVGANIGLFSMYAVKHRCRRVFAFEPIPATFNHLTDNIAELENVSAFQIGLSDRSREAALTYFPRLPGNTTTSPDAKRQTIKAWFTEADFKQEWRSRRHKPITAGLIFLLWPFRRLIAQYITRRIFSQSTQITAEFKRLDDVIDDNHVMAIDLLKVDVEGAEMDVFNGISDEHLSRVKQVVAEISPECKQNLPSLTSRLKRCGLRKIVVQPARTYSNPYDNPYACMLFARRE